MPGRARSASLPIAVALVVALLSAAPAWAQSAGDEQYQDPFGGEDQSQPQSGSDSTPEPAAPPPAGTPAPAPAAPQSAPEAAPTQLPYTGADARAVLLAGSVLLIGGIALHVRVRDS